jgi:formate hydrogenlyase subunit 6/NADH:ubiquinone oxidoreductase subunit I
MLSNVLGNLFSRPATRKYPYEKREPFKDVRGQVGFDMEKCSYCGACMKRCPAAAIEVNRLEKELKFEPFRCIVCNACVEICPKKCVTSTNQYRSPVYTKPSEAYKGVVQPKVEPRPEAN